MQATIATVLGILVGIVFLLLARRSRPESAPAFAWGVFVLGVITAAAFGVGTPMTGGLQLLLPASIALAVATAIAGIGLVITGNRRWQTWVGLVLGGAVALFWLAFTIGYIVSPA